jgi:hypothetical protein
LTVQRCPLDILKNLDEVIKLRKEAGKFYESRTSPFAQKNNATHAHWIKMLEDLRRLLADLPSHKLTGDVFDPHDVMSLLGLNDDSVPHAATASGTVDEDWLPDHLKPKPKTGPMHERPLKDFAMLSGEEEAEAEFAAWFFLRDVEQMLLFLREVWTRFRDGDIALVAAALATTQAVDIVKDMEAEFFARFKTVFARRAYRSVLEAILGRRINPQSFEGLMMIMQELPQEQVEFLMLGTWITLERFGLVIDKDYVSMPQPGFFDEFKPHADARPRSADNLERERDSLLGLHLAEVRMQCAISRGAGASSVEEAALTRDFREFIADSNRSPSITLVFQWHVWVDHVLINRRNLDAPLAQLHGVSRHIVDSARLWLNGEAGYSPYLYTDNNVEHAVNGVRSLILDQLPRLVLSDPLDSFRKDHGYPPSAVPFRLFRYNPWACGVALLKIISTTESCTNAFVNATGFIGSTLMMYDCLVQYDKIPRWPLMDAVLDIVAPVMYYGGRPERGKFLEVFSAFNGQDPARVAGRKDLKWKYDGHGVGTVQPKSWLGRVAEGQQFKLTSDDVADILQGPQENKKEVGFVIPGAKHSACDPYTLLKATAERVHKELRHSTFGLDMFALQLITTKFLQTWDRRGHNEFVEVCGEEFVERPSQISFLPGQFFMGLEKLDRLRMVRPVRKETISRLFQCAKETMEEARSQFGKWATGSNGQTVRYISYFADTEYGEFWKDLQSM